MRSSKLQFEGVWWGGGGGREALTPQFEDPRRGGGAPNPSLRGFGSRGGKPRPHSSRVSTAQHHPRPSGYRTKGPPPVTQTQTPSPPLSPPHKKGHRPHRVCHRSPCGHRAARPSGGNGSAAAGQNLGGTPSRGVPAGLSPRVEAEVPPPIPQPPRFIFQPPRKAAKGNAFSGSAQRVPPFGTNSAPPPPTAF